MKRAIVSMNIGGNPIYESCLVSQYKYATKYDYPYYLIQEQRINAYNFYFEKLQAAQLLDHGYDS